MQKLNVLNEYQVETITENIRYTTAREKAMSVLAYLTRLSDNNQGGIVKTYKDLHRMHQKSTHRVRISFENFKKIMKKLIELNLVKSDEKTKNTIHNYIVNKILPEILPNILPNEKVNESVDNTSIESDSVANSNKVNNNNIYNNNYTPAGDFGGTLEFEESQNITENLLKSLKVRSEFVKQLAFIKIGNLHERINRLGAESYIIKVIRDLVHENRVRYADIKKNHRLYKNKANALNNSKIQNFKEKDYNYDALALELAGLN